ncbi:hypothetical protein Tco_0064579 [Tanacetum coccineum]
MTNRWEDPKKKKPTMPTEDIKEEDIEETTTVEILEIGMIVNHDTITEIHYLMKTTRPFHQHPKTNSMSPTLKKPRESSCGKTYDPLVNPNAEATIIHDDSEDEANEAEKEVEPSYSKQTKSDLTPLKAYKPKIPYPQRLCKEKMEERYAKFIDLIKEVRINVPLVDVLAAMPNYGKFLKDLMNNKTLADLGADLGASINLMPYSLYASLSKNTLKPMRMRVEDDRFTFLIDKAMQHSHSNHDTCFRMDVIDEVTEEELDALLDVSEPFLNASEKINETSLDKKFKEFMNQDFYSRSTNDLEMKPLLKHLEYAFLEEDSLLPVVISTLLKDDEKKRLVSVLKKDKEAFAWTTSDISGISLSFSKHKINFEDDAKPVIQRQRRLNPNKKEVVKKEIIKLLDAGIIYPIKDSPWVSLVHCVPNKGGMVVMTNEKNELVPTRTVTGWHVCINYCKLNEATRKDHFPLPFMDQMLERLAGNKFFCFLDGFLDIFKSQSNLPIRKSPHNLSLWNLRLQAYAFWSL